ncbi:MAG: metallophosphoesterase [Pararheinheimera sp.]|nr:metallophosphoesterase [Rheinheimera sp.]
MSNFPAYDEVHVISDIHMGGAEPSFQVLRETKRLAGYIQWVGKQNPAGQVALVLNGDVFDTLAEKSSDYIIVDRAVEVVSSIMANPSFSGIWAALAAFVALERRSLVFIIGNHDIEISFPVVQRLIQQRLAGDDLSRKARIEFSTYGAGFSCIVGGATVYCTHGNEVDAWNFNRYEDLAKVGRRLNAGRTLTQKEWSPNAGTRMVKEVMNQVKERYKWIDLLKPETDAAVSTLVVLDPSQAKKIGDLLSIVGQKAVNSLQVNQRLSFEDFEAPSPQTAPNITTVIGSHLTEAIRSSAASSNQAVDAMLLQAEKNLGTVNAQLYQQDDGQLGTGQLIWDRLTGWLRGIPQDEALRRAMKDWLADDKSFVIDNQDDTYKEVTKVAGNSIDFIITGHTHLERAIDMGSGRYYFNCGTWIRLLSFTPQMLKDQASFLPVYKVLIDGKMESIDNASFGGQPFVMNQTSAVSIKKTATGAIGSLTHVLGDGTGEPQIIQQFERS